MIKRSKKSRRTGAAVVEFAVVAPLLFVLLAGMIEFGRMTMVKHYAVNASREAARKAVLPGADATTIKSSALQELANGSVSSATVTFSPQTLSSANSGDQVSVTIEVDPKDVTWLPKVMFMGSNRISATTTMRKEY